MVTYYDYFLDDNSINKPIKKPISLRHLEKNKPQF